MYNKMYNRLHLCALLISPKKNRFANTVILMEYFWKDTRMLTILPIARGQDFLLHVPSHHFIKNYINVLQIFLGIQKKNFNMV